MSQSKIKTISTTAQPTYPPAYHLANPSTTTCWCSHDTMGSFTTKTSFDTAKLCSTTALQPYLTTYDHPTQPRQVIKYLKSCSTVYFIWDPHNLEWFSDTQFMQDYDNTSHLPQCVITIVLLIIPVTLKTFLTIPNFVLLCCIVPEIKVLPIKRQNIQAPAFSYNI